MYKRLLCLWLIVVIMLSFGGAGFASIPEELSIDSGQGSVKEGRISITATIDGEFVDNHILVMLTNEESLKCKKYSVLDFPELQLKSVIDSFAETEKIVQAKMRGEASLVEAIGKEEAERKINSINLATYHKVLCLELKEPGKENVLKGIEALKDRDDIVCAEPNFLLSLCSYVPNDPYVVNQWGIYDIHMPAAWGITTGSSTVKVGVIDSGIQGTHSELSGRIDAGLSRNFLLSYNGNNSTDSLVDTNGHGTLVAGIIAAQGDNSSGMAGVAYGAKVVSLKVANSIGEVDVMALESAIRYADEANIPILSMSISMSSISNTLHNAIANYDGLMICSAGNQGNNIDNGGSYPAATDLPNIIVVGAMKADQTRLGNSNYGSVKVDIFAPGDQIYSCSHNGGYAYIGETSAATPFVAGVAALVLSQNPNFTPAQIKERILDGAEAVSALSNLCVTDGKLNAYRALHNHSYNTYQRYDPSAHLVVCSCGASKQELHTYTTIGGNTRVCTKCSYSPDILIQSHENVEPW